MKNKKSAYLMLIVVLAIWGAVIYKLFFEHKGGETAFTANSVFVPEPVNLASLNDTFSIHQGYRDPFLGKVADNRPRVSSGIPVKTPVKPTPALPSLVKWPPVQFHGLIKNQKSGKLIALVEIEGHGHNMMPGDVEGGLELIQTYKDSVILGMGKDRKTFRK
jgi:hypothetical protein